MSSMYMYVHSSFFTPSSPRAASPSSAVAVFSSLLLEASLYDFSFWISVCNISTDATEVTSKCLCFSRSNLSEVSAKQFCFVWRFFPSHADRWTWRVQKTTEQTLRGCEVTAPACPRSEHPITSALTRTLGLLRSSLRTTRKRAPVRCAALLLSAADMRYEPWPGWCTAGGLLLFFVITKSTEVLCNFVISNFSRETYYRKLIPSSTLKNPSQSVKSDLYKVPGPTLTPSH